MAFELTNQRGALIDCNNMLWRFALRAAEAYGWEPEGSLPPSNWTDNDGQWPGDYDMQLNQIVSASDASAMAWALGVLLKDADYVSQLKQVSRRLNADLSAKYPDPELKTISKDDALKLRSFFEKLREFCAAGSFVIG